MICKLCNRDVYCQEHHLIPKMVNARSRIRKLKPKEELRKTEPLCKPCHYQIHQLFTEKELGLYYNTIAKLKNNKSVQKWIEWIKTKPSDFMQPK